jgi:eukaryotic-like serine/threonine-protein kinase
VSSAGGPRILAGRYRLDEVIGRGGMSTVYRGTDLALDRVVAVKVALDQLAEENPVYVARFKREAHAAAALNHLGIVTVYDAGTDGATRFIVMEYVRGRSLAQILRDERPLEPARAARIAAAVADALSAAHAAGIVHRDVKPGNVMVADDGAVKVLDFGIARSEDAATITQTALVLGTAPYMSPEQALGQPADARSDIYSLGCVLYEMLTGEPPFMAEVPAAVMHQHVRVAPRPPVVLSPQVPPALNLLVLEMLAKSPDDRPQTTAEVRDRLRKAVAEPSTPSAVPPSDAGVDAMAGAAAASPPASTALPPASTALRPASTALRPASTALRPASTALPPASTALPPALTALPPASTVPPPASTVPPPASTRPTRPARRRALWGAALAIAALLVGAAVALALTAGSGSSGPTTTPPTIGTTAHTSAPTTAPPQTTVPPRTTTAATSATTATTTTTVTATTRPTTTTTHTTAPSPTATTTPTTPTSPGSGGVSPGQAATPPGQAKKQAPQ